MIKAKHYGWVHTSDDPPQIYVALTGVTGKTFPNNGAGATSAAVFISEQLDRNDWTLDYTGPLGYRITVRSNDDPIDGGAQ